MGNIELEVPHRRKPIFTQYAHNLTNYPQTRPSNNTVKQHNISRLVEEDHIETYRKRSPQILNQTSKLEKYSNKVGDFNDFLNEVKKHLKNNSSKNLKESHQSQQLSQVQCCDSSQKSSHQLVLKFRLQNQKIQLQKYKRLVQRELSKNHSIEEIIVEGDENQRKVTIHYDELPPKKGVIAKNIYEPSITTYAIEIQTEKQKHEQIMAMAKKQYQQLISRTQVLEQLINLYQKKQEENSKRQGNRQVVNQSIENEKQQSIKIKEEIEPEERVSKITGLFQNINQLHCRQTSIQTEIKAALELRMFDSQSDCSGSFLPQEL